MKLTAEEYADLPIQNENTQEEPDVDTSTTDDSNNNNNNNNN